MDGDWRATSESTDLALVPLEVAVLAARGLGDAVGEVAPEWQFNTF